MSMETHSQEAANAPFLEKVAQSDRDLFVEGHKENDLASEALSHVDATHDVIDLMKSPDNNIARKHFLKETNDEMHDLLDSASQAATLLELAITSKDGSSIPLSEWSTYVSSPDADPDVVGDIKTVLKFRQDVIGKGVNSGRFVDTRGLDSKQVGAWMNEVDEYALWKESGGSDSTESHLSSLASLAKGSATVGSLIGERLNRRLAEYGQGVNAIDLVSVAELGSDVPNFGKAQELVAKCVVGGIKTGRMAAGVEYLSDAVASRTPEEWDKSGAGRTIPGSNTTFRYAHTHATGAHAGRNKRGQHVDEYSQPQDRRKAA